MEMYVNIIICCVLLVLLSIIRITMHENPKIVLNKGFRVINRLLFIIAVINLIWILVKTIELWL